jgi:hypothetical protein
MITILKWLERIEVVTEEVGRQSQRMDSSTAQVIA